MEKTPRGKRWAARINRYHDDDDEDDECDDDEDEDDEDDNDDDVNDDHPKMELSDNIGYVLFSFKILPTELCAMSEKNQSGRFLNRMPTTKS